MLKELRRFVDDDEMSLTAPIGAASCVACARAAVVSCDTCGRSLCELHVDERSLGRAASFGSVRQICRPCARAEAGQRARRARAEEQAVASLFRSASPPGDSPIEDALWWGGRLRPVVTGAEVTWESTTDLPASAVRGGIVLALSRAGLANGDPARVAVALVSVLDDAGVLGTDVVPAERRLGAGYRDVSGWLLGPVPGPVRGERVTSAVLLGRTSLHEGRVKWRSDDSLEPISGFSVVRHASSLIVPLVISVAHRCAASAAAQVTDR